MHLSLVRLTVLMSLVSTASPAAAAPLEAHLVGATGYKVLERWGVTRPNGPPLDVYVARTEGRRPLVVLVQGSHCLPLFMSRPGREVSTLFVRPDQLERELGRVSFAVVERRGLRSFGAAPASEAEAKTLARCTAEHGGVDKRERVADVADAVRALRGQPWVGPVFVLGHSEGADVAAGVAGRLGDAFAGVGLLSGAGPTRFFDDIANARRQGRPVAVKAALDDLIALTGPQPPAEYAGAASVRQLSYAVDSTPLDDLRASALPIFVAGGTRDEKSPIESADLFVAEMLRARARRLRYVMLPDLDHAYMTPDGADRMPDVLRAFVDWALEPMKGRDVHLGL